jgi:hypothetical protein
MPSRAIRGRGRGRGRISPAQRANASLGRPSIQLAPDEDHLLSKSVKSPLGQHHQFAKELNMTALQGWIVIGLLVLIMLGIVGLGKEIQALPYLWRTDAPSADLER